MYDWSLITTQFIAEYMDLKITAAAAAAGEAVEHTNTDIKPLEVNEARGSEPGRLFYCFLVMLMVF